MEAQNLSNMITDYISKRKLNKLNVFDKETEKKRELIKDKSELVAFEFEQNGKIAELDKIYDFANWIDAAAKRAKQTSLVTHALKFTHPDAKGSSIYYAPLAPANTKYLCSQALKSPKLDAVGNAAALDVASFLQLENQGNSLISNFARDDDSALRRFATSEIQLQQWLEGFKEAVTPKELSSHTLAKQIYFPICHAEYHLLSPLYPSSLTQMVFEKITNARFSEESKAARKAKREKKYSDIPVVEFPNLAKQNFGGTKPQNISQLNSSRAGKAYLFNCAPPIWNSILRPPINSKSIFKDGYGNSKHVWRQVKSLQQYLISIGPKSSNKARRDRRAEYIDSLVDELFLFSAEIQSLHEYAGWSANSQLPKSQRLWLDPNRDDEAFQKERAENDWHKEIAEQFADWLNHKIKCDQLILGDVERLEWKSLVANKLRILKDDLKELA